LFDYDNFKVLPKKVLKNLVLLLFEPLFEQGEPTIK